MDRDNRKSHLAPQLSPATQDLLRASDSPTFAQQTPTSCKFLNSGVSAAHSLTELVAYRNDPRQAADHTNLAAQVDRLYIREWDQE